MEDLLGKLKEALPEGLFALVLRAGELAREEGQRLYLVGGGVRDLLLGRGNIDLDLVLEGDAVALARKLAEIQGGEFLAHPRFGTAKYRQGGFSLDLATSRTEIYPRPGALPTVKPAPITQDLLRRDSTINAMALHLTPPLLGQLLDPYGGRADLEAGLIRVLHEKSFSDDATRMLRALRYEARLGFRLEEATLAWLRRDLPMLKAISGDRLRHELELILKEEKPEAILLRASELGVLRAVHPALVADAWLAERFQRAKERGKASPVVYLCLLAYRLEAQEVEGLGGFFRFPREETKAVRDAVLVRQAVSRLLENPSPSALYHTLRGLSPAAIEAASIAEGAPASERLDLYLDRLRYIKPFLKGDELVKLGIPPGPRLGEALAALHEARLEGRVNTRGEEEALVLSWVKKG